MDSMLELTILMPCLDEAKTLPLCIAKAKEFLQRVNVQGEILIADNGSTDGSQAVACGLGARVIHAEERGYGGALKAGIKAAHGKYIVMGDADDSYNFSELDGFLAELRAGSDLVMGNRFRGGIAPGAMPNLHRYLGNPVLSFIGRLFYRIDIGDFHCGLRGFSRDKVLSLGLVTPGMEFASEMIVKASMAGFRITEIPTTLSPDQRCRPPHLRSWRDGWRHLRFLLIYSPRWLFLYPGIALFLFGLIGTLALLPGTLHVGSLGLDIHTMLYAAAAQIIGTQMMSFAVLTRAMGASTGLLPPDNITETLFKVLTLERGLLLGGFFAVTGISWAVLSIASWGQHNFGAMDPRELMRISIPAIVLMIVGFQICLVSFFASIIQQIPELKTAPPEL